MYGLLRKLFPKQHSVVEASQFASSVYLSGKSRLPMFLKIREQYKSSLVKTTTSLYMRNYIEKDAPSYEVIAIRGTVSVDDFLNDNLTHALSSDGMSEYQKDAYASLLAHMQTSYSDLPIVLTGHSMGGKIAEMLLAQFYCQYIKAFDEHKAQALQRLTRIIAIYSFDSPGTYPLLEKYFQQQFPNQAQEALSAFMAFRETRVIDVVGQPNSANMLHRHASSVWYLPQYGDLEEKPLKTLLLEDYTQLLEEKHSIDAMAAALSSGKTLIKVDMWGGISSMRTGSLGHLSNFASSYSSKREQMAKREPTLKNQTASMVTKFVIKRLARNDIAPDHPLIEAASRLEREKSQMWFAWLRAKFTEEQ